MTQICPTDKSVGHGRVARKNPVRQDDVVRGRRKSVQFLSHKSKDLRKDDLFPTRENFGGNNKPRMHE